jgi:hypothetical protein
VAGSLAQAVKNGGYLLRGDAMEMQVNLGRALDRRPLWRERLSGPRRPVERVHGSADGGDDAGRGLWGMLRSFPAPAGSMLLSSCCCHRLWSTVKCGTGR